MIPACLLLIEVVFAAVYLRMAAVRLINAGAIPDEAGGEAAALLLGHFWNDPGRRNGNSELRRVRLSVLMAGRLMQLAAVALLIPVVWNTRLTTEGLVPLGVAIVGGGVLFWILTRTFSERLLFRFAVRRVAKSGGLQLTALRILSRLDTVNSIGEVAIEGGRWPAGMRIDEIGLDELNLLVLGVYKARAGLIARPGGDLQLTAGDRLVVFGNTDVITEFAQEANHGRP